MHERGCRNGSLFAVVKVSEESCQWKILQIFQMKKEIQMYLLKILNKNVIMMLISMKDIAVHSK